MKVAEPWYPPYVTLTDDEVQWGKTENQWYKPEKNLGNGFPSWVISRGKYKWRFKYNRGSNTLVVNLNSTRFAHFRACKF